MIAIQMTATVTRRHSLLLFLDYEVCFLPLITLIYLGDDEVMRNIAIKIKKNEYWTGSDVEIPTPKIPAERFFNRTLDSNGILVNKIIFFSIGYLASPFSFYPSTKQKSSTKYSGIFIFFEIDKESLLTFFVFHRSLVSRTT